MTGAKYIINHVRVGGMPARLRDEKLPPRQGMLGDESLEREVSPTRSEHCLLFFKWQHKSKK